MRWRPIYALLMEKKKHVLNASTILVKATK